MKIEKVKLSDIFVAPKNVRRHPQKQIEELKKSYEMFGQYRPLIIGFDGEILVGNGLYEALKLAGAEDVEVRRLPQTATREYKDKLMLADNKTFMLGADDIQNIDEIMKSLQDFEIPGFDEEVLAEIYANLEEVSVNDFGSMGTVSPERIAEINKVAETRANVDEENIKVTQQDTMAPSKPVNAPNNNEVEEVERSYINCPHCGAKIWV